MILGRFAIAALGVSTLFAVLHPNATAAEDDDVLESYDKALHVVTKELADLFLLDRTDPLGGSRQGH